MVKILHKIVNYFRCEFEIFSFVESVESITGTKEYTVNKIKEIRLKWM